MAELSSLQSQVSCVISFLSRALPHPTANPLLTLSVTSHSALRPPYLSPLLLLPAFLAPSSPVTAQPCSSQSETFESPILSFSLYPLDGFHPTQGHIPGLAYKAVYKALTWPP